MSDLHHHLAAAARNSREAARHADDAVRHSRRALIGLVIVGIGLLLQVIGMVAARAADDVIVIPVENVIRAPEGTSTVVASRAVPVEQVGASCTVDARAENGGSPHPENDYIVSSNGSSVVLPDVEREPGAVTTGSGRVELGTSIVVTLLMGPDEVHSGGLTVTLDCDPPTTTTETTAWTTTTGAPTTTTSSVPTESVPSTVTEPTEPTTTSTNPTTTEPAGTSTSITTIPASSSSTSTEAPTTSTSTPPQDSSSTSTEPQGSTQTDELPRTGPRDGMIRIGLLLAGAGAALLLVERIGFGEAS